MSVASLGIVRFGLLLVALSFQARMLGAEELKLEEILISTQKHYPSIKAMQFEVEASEGALIAAEGAFDMTWNNRVSPGLSAQDSWNYNSVIEKPLSPLNSRIYSGLRRDGYTKYGDPSSAVSDRWITGLGLSMWRNRDTDRRRTDLQKSEFGVAIARAEESLNQIDVLATASLHYWNWVNAGLKVKIYQRLLETAQFRDRGLSERVKQGDLPIFEQQDNLRSIMERKNQLLGAQRRQQETAIAMSLFLRDSSGKPYMVSSERLPTRLEFEATLPDPIHKDIEVAFAQRPEVMRIQALQKSFVAERNWADNQLSPRVDLNLEVAQTLRAETADNRQNMGASLYVDIPIERFFAKGLRQRADASRLKLEYMEQLLKEEIQAEVQDAHNFIEIAMGRAEIASSEARLARSLESGERERFNLGDSHILFVNLREQATADASIREIDALTDIQRGKVQLKRVRADF